jgi:TolB-like protein
MLMAVGFPAVVIFAWVYEITPEGLRPTVEVPHHKSIRKLTGRRLDRAIIAVLAVALAYFVVDKFWIAKHVTPPQAVTSAAPETTARAIAAPSTAAPFAPPPHSIAVLPFVNLSGDKEQEYFSDGLTEELLNSLAEIDGLQVAARTSSFSFKEHPDIATVARKLNVAAVLEGSVRRSANTVRVTAQLVNAVTGFHLCLALSYHKLGRQAEAEAALARFKALQGDAGAYGYATIYAQWGDTREALTWLETALRLRDPQLVSLKTDPLLDPLRKEPRFQAFERELKFP